MQTFLFYVSKILRPILASPIFISLAFALTALFALPAPTKRKRRLKIVAIGICLLLALSSLPVVARALTRAWEYPLGDARALEAAGPWDAIVVLGGSTDARLSRAEHIELNDAAERLTGAAYLYGAGIAGKVLVSGGSGYMMRPEEKEAPLMVAFLERLGVAAADIIEEDAARNTFENAFFSNILLEEAGARRIVLITSAWHMRRSAAIFKKAGFEFMPYAVDSRLEYYGFPGDWLPDARALETTTRILREAMGVTAYRLLGRL